MKITTTLEQELINSITTELKVKNYITREIKGNTFITEKITSEGIDATILYSFVYVREMNTEETIKLPVDVLKPYTAILVHFNGEMNVAMPSNIKSLKLSKNTIIEDSTVTFNTSEFKDILKVWLDNNNNGFQKTEYLGRKLFIQLKPDLDVYFTEDKYAPYDAQFINSSGRITLVEIKTRDINHNTYKDALFEMKKLGKMKQIKEQKDAEKMMYINFYKDKKAVCWILEQYEHLRPVIIPSKFQTYGDDRVVDKRFIQLPISKGWIGDLNFESTHFNK